MLVVPDNGPVPELSVIVTILLAGSPVVESFPNLSRVRTAGWIPNGAPAVAAPGCVTKVSRLAVPAISVNVPRLVLTVTTAIVAVPERVRLPLARGEPALGRTRTFCHVNAQVTPAALKSLTVNVI